MRRVHHKVCILDELIVGWIYLTKYLLESTYNKFIDSGKPHFLQEERKTPLTYVIHHRLTILLDTRETDVLNLQLDEPKIKHSSRGVYLNALGKTICCPLENRCGSPQKSLKQLSREQGMY
ncbi:hypothetical protein AVEN_184447-1 [Araneus ventricosus]|uniref:Uncharacterized protein n=1 Tax=Araneus ventricosus TaxID=182803 RepID=A0A4Y2BFM8_ARAVE|nr:hypothetical protein AVEN_184447-1 [Araneus ventricosus]